MLLCVCVAASRLASSLGCGFYPGIVFLLISIFGIVDYIDKAVPVSLKKRCCRYWTIIAFIGLKMPELCAESTLIGLGNLGEPNTMLAKSAWNHCYFDVLKD